MKLCGFLITYNEEKKGNIRRCLDNLTKICDVICIYDDASTDKTVKICREYTPHIIVGEKNIGFPNKPQKNILMRYVMENIKPDWVYWIDADEITDRTGTNGGIRELCEEGDRENMDAFEIHEINLYMSDAWQRTDRLSCQKCRLSMIVPTNSESTPARSSRPRSPSRRCRGSSALRKANWPTLPTIFSS